MRMALNTAETALPDTDSVLRAAGLGEFVNLLRSHLFQRALRRDVPIVDELRQLVVAQAHLIKLDIKKDQHFRCARDLGELPANWKALTVEEQYAALARLGTQHPAVRSWKRTLRARIKLMETRKTLEETLRQKMSPQSLR